ncbi:hypothetical protein KS880_000942 [Vibrio parahaemolyticus]|nr:hypothetical protein [Vibrio parahaemolyticus]
MKWTLIKIQKGRMMMMKSTITEDLLQTFFASENRLQYANSASNHIDKVNNGRKSLNSSNEIKHLVSYDGSYIRYYVFCDDLILTNQVKEWIRHSLGTSHTYLSELRIKPQFQYEVDLLECYKHGVVVVTQLAPTDISIGSRDKSPSVLLRQDNVYIESVISRIINNFNRRPSLEVKTTRPLGRILRDFFWSCNQNDGKKASEFFEEIKSQDLLDYRNLTSLELQVFEASDEWQKVISHPKLEYLLSGVVSLKVTELVLKAYMETQHIDSEDLTQVDWDALEGVLLDNQSFFLRKPMLGEKGTSSVYFWKAWAISAFALNIQDFEQHIPGCVPASWLSGLLAIDRNTLTTNVIVVSEAAKLIESAPTLENAIKVLEYGESCFESEIKALVEWLFDLPNQVVRQIKSKKMLRIIFNQMEDIYYDSFPISFNDEEVIEQVSPIQETESFSEAIKQGSNTESQPKIIHTDKHIETWSDWFSGKEKAITLTYDYFRDWSTESYNADDVLQSIEETTDANIIRNVLPHFLKWTDEHQIHTQASLWVALLELIAIDDRKSIVTVELLLELTERCLSTEHVVSEYDRVVDAICICQENGLTPHTFSKFIDIYDLVYQYTPLNSQSLATAFNDLIVFGNQNWGRFTISQNVTFREMHQLLLGYEFPAPYQNTESEKNIDLKSLHISIGIYSLAESALSRAKEVIEKYCPNVKIFLNSDKANTSALTNMAKRADKIFFCDRSAAHQAYFAIKAISKDIVYVEGKGSSSIVRAFLETISSEK